MQPALIHKIKFSTLLVLVGSFLIAITFAAFINPSQSWAQGGGPAPMTISSCSCQVSDPGTLTEGDNFTVSAINCSGFPNMGAVNYYWDKDKTNGQANAGHTDDSDGDNSNTSGTMNYTGLSGSDQISKTISLYATDDSNSAYTERNVDVRVKDPVTGRIVEDSNGDLSCNYSSDPLFTGTAEIMQGPQRVADNNNGTYSTSPNEYLRAQSNINLTLNSSTLSRGGQSYQQVDKNPSSAVAGGETVDFCVSAKPNAWFQVQDGDVYGNSISIEIPATKYFMTGEQGPIITSNLSNLGPGGLQEGRGNPWLEDDNYTVSAPDYNDFKEIYATRIANNSDVIEPTLTGGKLTANNSHNGKVVFVNGDLEFDSNFTPGKAVFFVQGTTTITENVANTVNAAIVSGGNIIIEESPNNATLKITGMTVSLSGNIRVERTKDNNQDPAVKFIYDPGYLINFTDKLGRSRIEWQEVAN